MRRTILCFGSEVQGDDISFKLCDSLKKDPDFKFVKCENAIDIMAYVDSDEIIVLDNVKGLKKPWLFRSIEEFKTVESVTTHDIDLGTFLHVLDGMGKLKSVKIIGIPLGSKKSDVLGEMNKILSSQL
jgi:Ni,Fe-hydrogenase maturation factor